MCSGSRSGSCDHSNELPTRAMIQSSTTPERAATAKRAVPAPASDRPVERPQFYKASFDISRALHRAVPAARHRLDRLADVAETGADTPSTLSSVSGTTTPDCDKPKVDLDFDPDALAARLDAIRATRVTTAGVTSRPYLPAAQNVANGPARSSATPPSYPGIEGRSNTLADATLPSSKRRRDPSLGSDQPPLKMSKNAKKKAEQAAKVDRGEGDWGPRARKLKAIEDPEEQSGSHRRRCEVRREHREQPESKPWSAKMRGVFFERDRPFRLVLLDDDQEVKLSISSSRGAYVGSYGSDSAPGCAVSEEQAKRSGLVKVPWDGRHTLLILDENEVINVAFVPPPKPSAPRKGQALRNDAEPGPVSEGTVSFEEMCDALIELFGEADELNVPPKLKDGRRGTFIALNFGLQSGMGQAPHELKTPEGCEDYVQKLKHSEHLQRLATWQSEIFAYWAPLAHHHVRCQLKRLNEKTGLQPPFPRSVYPTACANCGPHTVCKAHRDKTNYPSCPCCVTALGDFDAEKGGHMALPDVGIYVPFPSGASCLLSSAAMTHGNLNIQPGETRHSFTQYCVGGLMRAVAYDMKLAKSLSDEERALMDEAAGEGWEAQYARFSNVWEIDEHRAWVREQDKLELLAEEQVLV